MWPQTQQNVFFHLNHKNTLKMDQLVSGYASTSEDSDDQTILKRSNQSKVSTQITKRPKIDLAPEVNVEVY